ncbi:uncharacterized protein PV06_06499 [Exophiala oligosperma]|uniref:Dihydrolipoamide acetyltransferase component of pyruvate dehydrogenase complex n=1 Tax=Exophiala oligosperma TaxID=215243 RepID=A0A0D2ALL5_9EURO|nr:uncharacterized protein PV06_06499 [Exophiala oligosperma]KIW40886.1 hypothetical protein PV06_06499 [Exophiala oligosperma]
MEIALNFLMRRLATQYLRGSGISRARFRYSQQYPTRLFHASPVVQKVVPFMLADIGEGITQCQVVQWFVEPGSQVEQFDPICEVQSDKASVEITSRFGGVIKSLHYAVDDMAIVGKALVDIDVDDAISLDDAGSISQQPGSDKSEQLAKDDLTSMEESLQRQDTEQSQQVHPDTKEIPSASPEAALSTSRKGAAIATPAIRHLLRKLQLDIHDIIGTGKDGRVKKEDIDAYISSFGASEDSQRAAQPPHATMDSSHGDKVVNLTNTEKQMFAVMTESLSIPHFLYSNTIDTTNVEYTRKAIIDQKHLSPLFKTGATASRITMLPFVLKAISQAFNSYPRLNAHLDLKNNPAKPQLTMKASHNFGIAVDTPQGLLVPVVKDVQNHSVLSLAAEIGRLNSLAQVGKLAPTDFKGATFTVSNIGSIGGGVVSPVIVGPQVAIVGLGRTRWVPGFHTNAAGEEIVVKKPELTLNWSADHRILDGATTARCAEFVRAFLENPATLSLLLR